MTEDEVTHAYRATLDPREPNARIVLADLVRACHVGETTLPDPPDPLVMARNEGKRATFLYIAGRLGLPLWPET